MKIVFCGAAGTHFKITDRVQVKLKKLIAEFLSSQLASNVKGFLFHIKADDGFGLVATAACFEFAEQHKEVECKFHFTWLSKEYYESLSEETKSYYADKVQHLASKGLNERERPSFVVEFYRNVSLEHLSPYEKKHHFQDICISFSSGKDYILTYLDAKSLKDKTFRQMAEWLWLLDKPKNAIDLYAASNTLYEKPDYTGVRKRRNSSKYYYRIKTKLPDGTSVSEEKGAFDTPIQASEARRMRLIALTTQECENVDRTFEDVFCEFVDIYCGSKTALKKKYNSYFSAHLKERMGNLNVGETESELIHLHTVLSKYNVIDGRTRETRTKLSQEYVSGMRAMLNNFYDYAYKKKYIKSHPMYALLTRWGKQDNPIGKKENHNFVQPLFAYSGNKHKLLPYITRLFPQKLDVFVDLFGGSAAVGINAKAKKIIVNDSDPFLVGIYNGIQSLPAKEAWLLVESIIDKYALNKDNERGYYACRDDYNKIPYKERCTDYWYWGLALVWCSFNRSTVQFNQQKEYNAPFGYAKVNFVLAKSKFFAFSKKIHSNDSIVFLCADYVTVSIPKNAFVYLDPPYLITTASYNKNWGEEEERKMYSYLEKLDGAGVKWAMSNVLQNNGKEHMMLSELIKQRKYRVHYLDNEYEHANFRRKNKGKTVEVLITNY